MKNRFFYWKYLIDNSEGSAKMKTHKMVQANRLQNVNRGNQEESNRHYSSHHASFSGAQIGLWLNSGSGKEEINMRLKRTGGFTLVEIMIVVAIIALLAAIAIPNLLRAKISANDALAKSTLRTMSTASETFSSANVGNYPLNVASLTSATPPYINSDPCGATLSGYSYGCSFAAGYYTFVATPSTVGSSGTTTWTITTGGVLTP